MAHWKSDDAWLQNDSDASKKGGTWRDTHWWNILRGDGDKHKFRVPSSCAFPTLIDAPGRLSAWAYKRILDILIRIRLFLLIDPDPKFLRQTKIICKVLIKIRFKYVFFSLQIVRNLLTKQTFCKPKCWKRNSFHLKLPNLGRFQGLYSRYSIWWIRIPLTHTVSIQADLVHATKCRGIFSVQLNIH